MKLFARKRGGLRAFGLFSLLCSPLAGCSPQKEPFVTDQLIGVWTTTHSAYVDRSMEIRSQAILFGTGDGDFTLHPILSVKAVVEGERTRYAFRYSHHGKTVEMSLYYGSGTITLKNQPQVVWRNSSCPDLSSRGAVTGPCLTSQTSRF